MICDLGEVTERLENELSVFLNSRSSDVFLSSEVTSPFTGNSAFQNFEKYVEL